MHLEHVALVGLERGEHRPEGVREFLRVPTAEERDFRIEIGRLEVLGRLVVAPCVGLAALHLARESRDEHADEGAERTASGVVDELAGGVFTHEETP